MYHIIVNPNALKGKNKDTLHVAGSVFDHTGKPYTVHYTERAGHAKDIATEICNEEEAPVIIVMGGDGTLHEVVNGVTEPKRCRLGLIPIGTGNDFADAVGIPLNNVKRSAEIIAFTAAKPIDYIQLSSGLRSINAVGFGIDVDILKRTYEKNMRGRTKYLRSLIACLFHFNSYDFTAGYNGEEHEYHGLIAALGNGKQFGGGIKLFPQANVRDGYMELVVVEFLSRKKIPGAFIKLMRGKLGGDARIHQLRVTQATFKPHAEHYTIQAEGELYDDTPVEAQLIHGELKFYLPDQV